MFRVYRIWGLGFVGLGFALGFRVWGFGFIGFRVYRVQGLGGGCWGLRNENSFGFGVQGRKRGEIWGQESRARILNPKSYTLTPEP